MIEGPMNLVIIREFWTNVSLLEFLQDAPCIKSYVFGIPITLTTALIGKAISCKEVGVHMDMYPRTSHFLKAIPYKILDTKNDLASVSSLLPKENI